MEGVNKHVVQKEHTQTWKKSKKSNVEMRVRAIHPRGQLGWCATPRSSYDAPSSAPRGSTSSEAVLILRQNNKGSK